MELKTGQYDVVIVGAGPAGCACALSLKDSGLKVAMLDKSTFPRDKVCGDAIPGRAIKTLTSISHEYGSAFKKFAEKFDTKSTSIHYKGNVLTFEWVADAYTCTRIEFDNFLFSLVKEHTATDIFTDTLPHSFSTNGASISISFKNKPDIFNTKIVIGADGAQSTVAKQLTGRILDRDHHVGSVRAYYYNVAGMEGSKTEIYFDRKFLPSYLWVFPLPGNVANVGFGMLSSEIARRKINLKTAFHEFIAENPLLKEKFAAARQIGLLEGFGLPLGSGITTLSGQNFMLVGDAASLIDPISGDGIGNAMLSGKLAAAQAIRCFTENNFSDTFMSGYDATLLTAIGQELKARYRAQRSLSKMPWLLDMIFFAGRNKALKRIIQKML